MTITILMCQSKNISTLGGKQQVELNVSNIKEHTCARVNSKALNKYCLARPTTVLYIPSGLFDAFDSLITIQRKRKISNL